MWRPLEQKVQLHPSMRSKMATAMSGSRLYVFGGLGAGPVNEMWVFDLKAMRWSPIRPEGPSPPGRCGHSFTTDAEGHIWLFGGQAGSKEKVDIKKEGASSMRVRMLDRRNVFSDSWVFDPNAANGKGAWEEQRITGISPSPRRGHSATLVTTHKRSSKANRDHSTTGDDNHSVNSLTGSPMEQESKSKRRTSSNSRELPQELYVIGGAGPDPGKGFETVHAQLWIFNLKRRDWCQADCKGLPPDSWARFEHTATLVPGGMQGVGAGDTLVVVGGVSASTVDTSHLLNQGSPTAGEGVDGGLASTGPNGASYNWGGPESRILALAVDTHVWTQLITAIPSSNLMSSFASQFSEEPICPAPSLHGHATVPNPFDQRELLVFGGRGEKEWSNELYSLVLPPPHSPGMSYPGMPKKKWGKKMNSSSPNPMTQTQGATTKLIATDDDDQSCIPEPLAEWQSLGSSVSNDLHISARYGHCLATWLPPSFIKERERQRGDGDGGRVSRSGRSKKSALRAQENNSQTDGIKVSNGGQDMGGPDLSPKAPGILLFGGSLSGLAESSGYANSDVHFLDLDSMRSPGDLRKVAKSKESHDQSKTLSGSIDGSVQRSVHHSQESQLSQSQVILAKLVLDGGGNGDSLPSGYSEMKQLLLGQREDHRTSKLKRGDKSRTAPASFGVSSPGGGNGGLGTSMLGTTAGANSAMMGRTMGGATQTQGNSMSSTSLVNRNSVSSPLSSANSTMAYMKLRRLADHDARFEPTPFDMGRSALMKEILTEAVFPPLPTPSSGPSSDGTIQQHMVRSTQQRRPQTAEELFAKKANKERLKHKTPKEKFQEKWAVPGLYELVNPKPRAIVTITEARRRFRVVTEDPTISNTR